MLLDAEIFVILKKTRASRSTCTPIVGVWFGAGAMFVFLALAILYTNDRLTGFAMATKTCRAAKLY